MNHFMREYRIPIRVVFYQDDGKWFAHCLEFDLIGDGPSKPQAAQNLLRAIELQLESSVETNNPRDLFNAAPPEIEEMFAAGKDIGNGEVSFRIKVDHVQIQNATMREFEGAPADLVCA